MILKNFSLLKLAILPAIINVICFGFLIFAVRYIYTTYLYVPIPPNLVWYTEVLHQLRYILTILFTLIVYLLVCFFTFSTVGGIVASPFLDMLSERAEFILLKRKEETPFSLKLLIYDIAVVLWQEAKKCAKWLGFTFITLPLLLLPLIGQVLFFFPNAILAAYFLGLGFIDFSISRRRLSFQDRKAFNKEHFWEILGFGGAVYVTLLVPLLGFICLPVSTVGGTILFCENASKKELQFRVPDVTGKRIHSASKLKKMKDTS